MFLVLGALCWQGAGAQVVLEEAPKAALVNIQALFRAYYKTLDAQNQINTERARIQKENNELMQRVAGFDRKLQELKGKLQGSGMAEAERKVTAREAGLLYQEREALERAREESIQVRHQELNRKMMARMKGILGEIRKIVEVSAERAGYDYVFDVDGLNTAQVPFLIYAKEAINITPMLLKELNKNAPIE